nr:cysteine-rich receptor-like protein kinase 3 [Ipomoea trifida]
MNLKMASLSKWVFLSIFFLSINRSVSDPRASELALICTNRTAPQSQRQSYVVNFVAALDALTPLVDSKKYGETVIGAGNATVYAFGECMRDLSQTDCNLCFAQIKTQILRCLPFQRLVRGGRLFYDGCFVRYDDYVFFNESLSLSDRTVCGSADFGGNSGLLRRNAAALVGELGRRAAGNDGFFTAAVGNGNSTVYGLAQCWEFVRGKSCEDCLAAAVSEIGSCLPKEEGRVLNAGCFMRYSTKKFYDNSTIPATNQSGRSSSNHLPVILATTLGFVAFLLILGSVAFIVRKRIVKQRKERKQLGAMLVTVNKSKLNFSYETLERATNYFDDSNKLGQGGSGCVYKGVLPDGQAVAIKRLFFNTTQWVDHFFNEVNLISGIHHKNLVKLLGCSITGPESLLVYEFVPNQSLYDYTSVRKNLPPLSWEQRYKIILGTAEGLAYLHEETELCIIHRDIKLSNVLLDEDFTPKIADFGLVRLFPEDKSHISTAVAGTLGYMAPEYVVQGKLTEKADVYSFGVLVIEVVSGKKNSSFYQTSVSLLQQHWNLFRAGKLYEAVDASLEESAREEATRQLQIGLVCVQASPELRPSMSAVVKMISGEQDIPEPTQPPFLTSNSAAGSSSSYPKRGVITPYSQPASSTQSSVNTMTESWIEPR